MITDQVVMPTFYSILLLGEYQN